MRPIVLLHTADEARATIEDALARPMLAGELLDGQTVTFDVDADGSGLVVV